MNPAFCNFEFDLPGALLIQLIKVLDGLGRAPLTQMGLEGVPEAQGVYQLFLDGTLVYIGKTDADAGLRARLDRHSKKIQHRMGLSPERVEYKAVRIFVFTAIDLEGQLIAHYNDISPPAWTNSGFGANDPGQNRDRTVIRPTNFDALFPIDLDRELDASFADCSTAAQAARRLKLLLPYNFRFARQTNTVAHSDLELASINLADVKPTARDILTAIVDSLPPGWQVTALRSHVILYKEHANDYPDVVFMKRS